MVNELNNYFKLASNNLRGHALKRFKPRCNLNVHKFAFQTELLMNGICKSST